MYIFFFNNFFFFHFSRLTESRVRRTYYASCERERSRINHRACSDNELLKNVSEIFYSKNILHVILNERTVRYHYVTKWYLFAMHHVRNDDRGSHYLTSYLQYYDVKGLPK